MRYLFTSESVTEGHPDKVCDQIADAILDDLLKQDANSRVACEVTCTTGIVNIIGEISTEGYTDCAKIARNVIRDIGYTGDGFSYNSCAVSVMLNEQSPDIAIGVNKSFECQNEESLDESFATGAGDQGMMFGYAANETPELMPLPISLAHKLAKQLEKVRKENIISYLKPDGKSQVTVEYENGKPLRVDAVVISTQHAPDVNMHKLRNDIKELVIRAVIPEKYLDNSTKFYINPTGRFVVGGPEGDSGLTGRKIIVDTYGGYGRHGGGSFSGKDPTKVDRSGAYAARHIAKNIVAAKLAEKCEVQISYAIGVATPISLMVETFGTGLYSDEKLSKIAKEVFDLRPALIIKKFDLKKPIYRKLSTYGHMGREDLNVAWEKLDKVDDILKAIKK